MKLKGIALFGCFLSLSISMAFGQERPVKSQIVSASLFKNGLSVIRREVSVLGPGNYVVDDVPQPVHGTYWVQGTSPIETVVQMHDAEVAADDPGSGNLQDDLAGKKVTIHLKGEKSGPVVGTVIKLKSAKVDDIRGVYESYRQPGRFLVMQTAKGRSYVDFAEISHVDMDGSDGKIKRRQPRLLLTVTGKEKNPQTIAISYLSKGLSWSPGYRLDISDPKTLSLEQNAVIKNELADLADAEIKLISGFPSIRFSYVTSPLSLQTNWANFFRELSQQEYRSADYASNSIVTQNVAYNPVGRNGGLDLGAIPTGEGIDLHFRSIGKRTLALGEALELKVGKGTAPYERVVEWLISDTRDEFGRHGGGRRQEDNDNDSAWDALRFKNPLDYPMTTGPALVVSNGGFNGLRTNYWVNAGEETLLRVNKALSIRTRSAEHEELKNADGREIVWIGGRQYRRSTVVGELEVCNHRKESISMVLRRRFSGELIDADGEPKKTFLEEGVFSVNVRNELNWSLSLKPGEKKKLNYRYSVLVIN